MNEQQREEIDKLKMRLELKKMGVQDIQEKLLSILSETQNNKISQELHDAIKSIDRAMELLSDIV